MAKIFRTETLALNADNIRLTAGTNGPFSRDVQGNFEFVNADGSVMMSRKSIDSDISSLAVKDVDIDSDVSSLQFKDGDLDFDVSSLSASITDSNADVNSDISSLTFKDGDLDFDVSSLHHDIDNKDLDLDSDISSLQYKDGDLDFDVSSLSYNISQNDSYVVSIALGSGADSHNQTLALPESNFGSIPKVAVALVGNDSDPILGYMVTEVSAYDSGVDTIDNNLNGASASHKIKIAFADEVPTANYSIQVIAAI